MVQRVDLADVLRGVPERGVVGPDDGVGDQRGDPVPGQRVVQGAHQQGADHALGLGAEQIERTGSAQSGIRCALHGEHPYLRAVAVGEDDLVFHRERGDRGGDAVDVRLLDVRVGAFTSVQQGVAAEGDDDTHGSALQGGDENGLDGVQPVLRIGVQEVGPAYGGLRCGGGTKLWAVARGTLRPGSRPGRSRRRRPPSRASRRGRWPRPRRSRPALARLIWCEDRWQGEEAGSDGAADHERGGGGKAKCRLRGGW